MAHLTVVFWERTSVQACRNLIAECKHRIVWENPQARRFIIEVPDGQQWVWAPRYKAWTAVRTTFYACEQERATPESVPEVLWT